MDSQTPLEVILSYLPPRLRLPLERACLLYDNRAHEITLRVDRPLCVYMQSRVYFLSQAGVLEEDASRDPVIVTELEVRDTLLKLCDYSVYARHDEIRHGYLTIRQGIRVGLCGTAVHMDQGVNGLKDITTLSFRIPREVKHCADDLLNMIDASRGVLICGPPCSGKTTLIRDMARQLSYRYRVTVADERGEISAPCGLIHGCDIGLADVYVRMPKGRAIINSVRSLSPDIIVCDELGDEQDARATEYALRCGVSFIATVHASCVDDLRVRPVTASLLSKGAFRYLVFLNGRSHPGRIVSIDEWRPDHA